MRLSQHDKSPIDEENQHSINECWFLTSDAAFVELPRTAPDLRARINRPRPLLPVAARVRLLHRD